MHGGAIALIQASLMHVIVGGAIALGSMNQAIATSNRR
jgi:hypothetical protein